MIEYPSTFPIDSIKEIVNAVKDGSVAGDTKILCYHAWIVQGYAQKMLLGNPSTAVDDGFHLMSLEDQDLKAIKALEELANTSEVQAQFAIPWSVILPFLLRLLQQYLSNIALGIAD